MSEQLYEFSPRSFAPEQPACQYHTPLGSRRRSRYLRRPPSRKDLVGSGRHSGTGFAAFEASAQEHVVRRMLMTYICTDGEIDGLRIELLCRTCPADPAGVFTTRVLGDGRRFGKRAAWIPIHNVTREV